jgi:hypothetical protein
MKLIKISIVQNVIVLFLLEYFVNQRIKNHSSSLLSNEQIRITTNDFKLLFGWFNSISQILYGIVFFFVKKKTNFLWPEKLIGKKKFYKTHWEIRQPLIYVYLSRSLIRDTYTWTFIISSDPSSSPTNISFHLDNVLLPYMNDYSQTYSLSKQIKHLFFFRNLFL